MKTRLLSLAALSLACVPASAQAVLPAPLQPLGPDAAVHGGLRAAPSAALVTDLALAGPVVRLEGWSLPDGGLVDLELERIDVQRRRFGFFVDGQARPDLLAGLELSVWQGTVAGEPGSSVMLGFSNVGVRGWLHRGDQLVHVMPRPDAEGDWSRGDVLLVTEQDLGRQGMVPEFECASLPPTPEALPPSVPAPPTSGGGTYGATCNLYECTVAMETDYQLHQLYNDLSAQTAYVTTLLSWISARYEEQIDTVLTYPYLQFYTTPNDPWSTPDTGGNSIDMLNEFVGAWQGNVPMGANLAHFMSGASLGGGVAYLDVLCNGFFNFGVSGNIDGQVNFPVQQQPNNWDFMVVAHELGHNFSTPHTHDYCPPLDECPPSAYFGQCQTQQVCSNAGTIMSYCHLCPGGTGNITTFFHPTVVDVMKSGAASCLPYYSGIFGTTVDLFDPTGSTVLTAEIAGTPVGAVELLYRFGSAGAFTAVAMTDQGGGSYSAAIPAAPCGTTVEYYYAFTEASCGLATSPEGAPASVFSAGVGILVPSLVDDFEADNGWTPVNLGASTGDWERGVPVNDAGWDHDPAADFDGSGSAWLTMNQLGNTDVDGGAVELTSPVLDLSAPDLVVSYAYFLRLTNANGADRLLVEASSNGTAGPWFEVARHDTDGGLDWRTHQITSDDFVAAGVILGSNMALRFNVNDDDPQSIVEAGLDAFTVASLVCDDSIGTPYCVSSPNSTGSAATMSASGTTSVAANGLELAAGPVPNGETGIFYYGPNQLQIPFGNGTRCVGGFIGRLPVTTTAGGQLTSTLDVTSPPNLAVQVTPGSTWFFQAWFRDMAAGGSNFDLSDGLEVSFTP